MTLLRYNSVQAEPRAGHWFRYYDEPGPAGEPQICLEQMRVLRETAKCVILEYQGTEKRVLKDARKRFAYPNIPLARESYEIRKKWQMRYVQAQFDRVKAILERIEAGTAYDDVQSEDFLSLTR